MEKVDTPIAKRIILTRHDAENSAGQKGVLYLVRMYSEALTSPAYLISETLHTPESVKNLRKMTEEIFQAFPQDFKD